MEHRLPKTLLFLPLLLVAFSPSIAKALTFELAPSKPVKGDTVTLTVRGEPSQTVWVKITFNAQLPVDEDGCYLYKVRSLNIPPYPNRFTVKAVGVQDLHASVKVLFWITKSVTAVNGEATLSQSGIPPGTYDVVIHGAALPGVDTVQLTFTAEVQLTLNEEGTATYSYDTTYLPTGEFKVEVNGLTRTFTLTQPVKPWISLSVNTTFTLEGMAVEARVEPHHVQGPITLYVNGHAQPLQSNKAVYVFTEPGTYTIYAESAEGVKSNTVKVRVAPLKLSGRLGYKVDLGSHASKINAMAKETILNAWNKLLELSVNIAFTLTLAATIALALKLLYKALKPKPPLTPGLEVRRG